MGGVINVIPRSASFEWLEVEAEAQYGSFLTDQAGVRVGAPIAEGLAVRADASLRSSDGYVDRAASLAVLRCPAQLNSADPTRFHSLLRHDFGEQNPVNYWGAPLAKVRASTRPFANAIKTRWSSGGGSCH